jgi:hypothetical protein
MAYSKDPETFPRSMRDAIGYVAETGRAITIPYASHREAKGRRLQFYALKTALKAASIAPPEGITHHNGDPARMPYFRSLTFRLVGADDYADCCKLQIIPIDATAEALATQKAIHAAIDESIQQEGQ